MGISETLRTNEIHGGTCSWGDSSIAKNVHVGDLIELLVDGKFFNRPDQENEKYSGYISHINNFTVGLSPTHPDNKCHGFSNHEASYKPKIVEIETCLVKNYRIIG